MRERAAGASGRTERVAPSRATPRATGAPLPQNARSVARIRPRVCPWARGTGQGSRGPRVNPPRFPRREEVAPSAAFTSALSGHSSGPPQQSSVQRNTKTHIDAASCRFGNIRASARGNRVLRPIRRGIRPQKYRQNRSPRDTGRPRTAHKNGPTASTLAVGPMGDSGAPARGKAGAPGGLNRVRGSYHGSAAAPHVAGRPGCVRQQPARGHTTLTSRPRARRQRPSGWPST